LLEFESDGELTKNKKTPQKGKVVVFNYRGRGFTDRDSKEKGSLQIVKSMRRRTRPRGV
jgi:hypothetical protein